MNDVLLSLLRGIVIAICSALVTKGIVSLADAPALQTALMTLLPSVVAAGMAWWGAHTQTDASKVSAIRTLDPAAATTAVNNLPPAAKTEIKLAAITDKDLIKAASAIPDVTQITVKDTATDGVADAAKDKSLPKVVTTSDAKAA